MPQGYQSFKVKSTRTVYCSGSKFKNHAEGSAWVAKCIAHFNLRADDTMEYKFPLDDQPRGATIWSP